MQKRMKAQDWRESIGFVWTDVERGWEVGEDAKMLQGVGREETLKELIKADDEDLMVRLQRR